MAYRTKYHNLIWNNYLNKVFDFIGLTTESSSGCSRIKFHCRQIEREHGPVRLMFTPLYFGDKLDAVFKDYNPENQPILKNNVNIDNESKINNEISTEIFDAQQFQEEG